MVSGNWVSSVLEETTRVGDVFLPFSLQVVTAHPVFLIEEVIYLPCNLIIGVVEAAEEKIVVQHARKLRFGNQRDDVFTHAAEAGRINDVDMPSERERVAHQCSVDRTGRRRVEDFSGVDGAAQGVGPLLRAQHVAEV